MVSLFWHVSVGVPNSVVQVFETRKWHATAAVAAWNGTMEPRSNNKDTIHTRDNDPTTEMYSICHSLYFHCHNAATSMVDPS